MTANMSPNGRSTSPPTSRLDVHQDAFGNVTHVLTYGPIADLTITVEGLIETHDTGGVLRGTDERFPPSLFLRSTDLTLVNPAMANFARELRSESESDVLGFLHALMMQINEHMTFDEDPTNSGTSAAEAFALKRGVCQDYAHIFIACARTGGVPARFVAGHFLRSDGMVQQQAGHAWAEAFVPDLGWVGFDPANAICTTDAHARVAIGLDYLGAAPVRGTRYGGGMETLSVAVRVEQAADGRASRNPSRNACHSAPRNCTAADMHLPACDMMCRRPRRRPTRRLALDIGRHSPCDGRRQK